MPSDSTSICIRYTVRPRSGISALAAVPADAADIAAGKEKAELCVGCHGEAGISQTENIPSLAGQPDQFIQWQLVFFRTGTRKSDEMRPVVEQISNEDIRNLGAYLASLTPPKTARTRRQSRSIPQRRRGRRGPALRVMPYRHVCGHKGGCPPRRPARGLPAQGAARLQVGRAVRRRHGGDGGGRLSPERRGNHRARPLPCEFMIVIPAKRSAPGPITTGVRH